MAKQKKEAGQRQETPASARWRSAFIWAVGAVAVATVALLVAVAGAFGGSQTVQTSGTATDAAPTDSPGTQAPPATTTSTPSTKTAPPSTAATTPATATADSDNTPLVRCGDILAPLDKQHRLAPDCVPSDLVALPGSISAEGAQSMRSEAASAIQDLFAAARKEGYVLFANSTYRSYQQQVDTFNYWVRTNGLDYAERTSARAGHSEHQLGTTADVGLQGQFLEAFSGTPAAKWLADNAAAYGFTISYPDGKESITGYAPEPWHIRYVGKDTAARVKVSGLTLHEFLLR